MSIQNDLKQLLDLQDIDERERRELTQRINSRKKQIASLEFAIRNKNQQRIV